MISQSRVKQNLEQDVCVILTAVHADSKATRDSGYCGENLQKKIEQFVQLFHFGAAPIRSTEGPIRDVVVALCFGFFMKNILKSI